MPLLLPELTKSNYTPAPGGSHVAVCYGIVDCGTQAFTWNGELHVNPNIAMFFELQNELMENGKPFTISAIMNLKPGGRTKKSKLRVFLEAWRGVAFKDEDFGTFDLFKLVGIGCMLNIIQETKDDKQKSKINGIMRLPKGTTVEESVNPKICFSLKEFDQTAFDSLTDYWKELIAKSPEYKQIKGDAIGYENDGQEEVIGHLSAPLNLDEEIPF